MMTWSSFPETRHDVYKGFAQMSDADDEADHPGVKLIGRWHDLGGWCGSVNLRKRRSCCFAILGT